MQIDGGPLVLLNCASIAAAQPATSPDAVAPNPGRTGDGPPYRASGTVTVEKPAPMNEVTV